MAESAHAGSFESLLDESRDLVCERLRGAVALMLDKADEALTALATQTQKAETHEACRRTRKVLAAGRGKLETQFQQAYLDEFLKRTKLIRNDSESFAELNTSLHLVGEDDLEDTLKFKQLATKLRRSCEDELGALDRRAGALLGEANVEPQHNPFGPETICDAYQQACRALEADAQVRDVLRKLFDDQLLEALGAIYKDVNALLVRHSILPTMRYGVAKKPDEPRKADAAKDKGPAAAAQAQEQNVFALLQQLVAAQMGAGPGAAGGAGPGAPGGAGPGAPGGVGAAGVGAGGGGTALPAGVVVLQGAELVGSLTRLQRGDTTVLPGCLPAAEATGTVNVLRELKSSGFAARLVQMDATTLDIVAMLFDQLFDDPNIPVGLKSLIGRLQIPMLKVAIADKSFFASKSHPARALLDTFGDLAVRLPAEFGTEHPIFVRIEALVQHLLDSFQENVGVFDAVRAQLEVLIAEHDQRLTAASQAAAQRIEQTENLALAKTAAEEQVKLRVQARPIPGAVLEFLVEQWRRLLLLVHVRSGASSAEWQEAIETMDQLIWSVEPKASVEDRRKLAALVPGLVKRLVAGMQALGTQAAVRERFLDELMKIHTEALEAKPKAKPLEKPAAPATPPARPDFSGPLTIKNPYGAGEVWVTGVDYTPVPADMEKRAAAKAALASSLVVDPPANMAAGAWVEFRPTGEGAAQRVAKLLFVSPKKTRYLFCDRRGKNVLELSRAEVVQRLRTGEARRLDHEPHEPLFERIMSGLMDKLRAPAIPAA